MPHLNKKSFELLLPIDNFSLLKVFDSKWYTLDFDIPLNILIPLLQSFNQNFQLYSHNQVRYDHN